MIVTKLMKWVSEHILLAPLMTVAVVFLFGCKSVYIPVETVRADSVYLNKTSVDTLIVKDSVYVYEKGDTVYQYKYKYIYKDRIMRDTSYVERTDTIRVPYPIERKLSKWEEIKMNVGGYALAVGSFFILIVFGIFVLKIKKKL